MKYDHFHAIYEDNGDIIEIEGGFNGLPKRYDNLHICQQWYYCISLAVAWGMPQGTHLKNIWLAG